MGPFIKKINKKREGVKKSREEWKEKNMIYLACLLFAFSWRADSFFKGKIDMKSQVCEL